jgi:hypothetical protein
VNCRAQGCLAPAVTPPERQVACYPHWWTLGPMMRKWLIKQWSSSEVRPTDSYERAMSYLVALGREGAR